MLQHYPGAEQHSSQPRCCSLCSTCDQDDWVWWETSCWLMEKEHLNTQRQRFIQKRHLRFSLSLHNYDFKHHQIFTQALKLDKGNALEWEQLLINLLINQLILDSCSRSAASCHSGVSVVSMFVCSVFIKTPQHCTRWKTVYPCFGAEHQGMALHGLSSNSADKQLLLEVLWHFFSSPCKWDLH